MPFYVYEVILPDGSGGEKFEVTQSMSDPPLTRHPETGEPVRRVITPPRVLGASPSRSATRALADDRKLGEMGFTKYVRTEKGRYEKRTGKGPDSISAE